MVDDATGTTLCHWGSKYYFFERNINKDTDMAAKYFERTTQLNPSYALTWVGLSRVSDWQVNVGLVPAEEGHRQLSDL